VYCERNPVKGSSDSVFGNGMPRGKGLNELMRAALTTVHCSHVGAVVVHIEQSNSNAKYAESAQANKKVATKVNVRKAGRYGLLG
jgi:hypothetical protein